MQIKCFDDKTGMCMDIPTVVDYKYEVIVPTDQMVKDSFNLFIADVDEFLEEDTTLMEEEYCFAEKYTFPFDLFTKLPYLYYDLCVKELPFKYPAYVFPDRKKSRKMISGLGRTLIASTFSKDVPLDITTHSEQFGTGGEEIIRKLINDISNNRYWMGNVKYPIAVVLLDKYKEDLYVIKELTFTDENYLNSYRNFTPAPFVERCLDMELWNSIKLILNSGKYYDQLLEDIVFKNLDYVKNKVL
jgi:hypothetical protein